VGPGTHSTSFADRAATEGFVEILRQVKRRDGLTVFAWCVMSNHSGAKT
jgi:REP element-mobilizing transposase RayT